MIKFRGCALTGASSIRHPRKGGPRNFVMFCMKKIPDGVKSLTICLADRYEKNRDFLPISRFISETMQDKATATMKRL